MVENQSSISEESREHKAELLLELISEADRNSSIKNADSVNFFLENNLYVIEKLENNRIKSAQEKQENKEQYDSGDSLAQKLSEPEELLEQQIDENKTIASQEAASAVSTTAYARVEQEEDIIDYEVNKLSNTATAELHYPAEAGDPEETSAEIKPIKMEVVETMIKNEIGVENPNFDFLNSYVSPDNRERYAVFKMLNPAAIRTLEISMLQYSGEPKF